MNHRRSYELKPHSPNKKQIDTGTACGSARPLSLTLSPAMGARGHSQKLATSKLARRVRVVLPLSNRISFIAVLFIGFTAWNAPSVLADEIHTYFLMDQEPEERPAPAEFVLDPGLLPLWRKALSHPESELKRQAAEAVAKLKRLDHDEADAAVPELLSVLIDDQVHPAARHAAAHALIVLDQREVAQSLFAVSQQGNKDLRQLVEPALAKWDFEEIKPVWRRRIENGTTPRRDLILAIQGLGQVGDAEALPGLMALTMELENPADIRLAAVLRRRPNCKSGSRTARGTTPGRRP